MLRTPPWVFSHHELSVGAGVVEHAFDVGQSPAGERRVPREEAALVPQVEEAAERPHRRREPRPAWGERGGVGGGGGRGVCGERGQRCGGGEAGAEVCGVQRCVCGERMGQRYVGRRG